MTTSPYRVVPTAFGLALLAGLPVSAQPCIWEYTPASSSPGLRFFQSTAYDAGRDRIVLFGGSQSTYLGDTWEWDGSAWLLRSTTGPSPRSRAAMAYDSVRSKVVLFGGMASPTAYLNDTWEWDGSTWTRLADAPPQVNFSAMAFDSVRGRTVALGGSALRHTLEWDGASWTVNPAQGPNEPAGSTMVFDAARARIILAAAGLGPNAPMLIFEYDGVSWTQRPSTNAPPARQRAAAAFDPIRRRLILTGGLTGSQLIAKDTWEWDPTTAEWSRRAEYLPWIRPTPSMAWDSARGKAVLIGRPNVASDIEVWYHNGAGTSEFQIAQPPQNLSIDIFEPVQFSVVAPNATAFRWYLNNAPLTDGPLVSGASTDTLSISYTTFSSAGTYTVVAHGHCGPAYASATLSIAPNSCYANCDTSSGFPVLTAGDFQCFLNKFAAGHPYANCDGSTGTPLLTANDFVCYLNAFVRCQ
ncbi:MAG: hypothetical protein KF678_13380 [Phycisphaeraceae bacterium]|nr:hypothetical protein [Phycisphaeraceae bacterium]